MRRIEKMSLFSKTTKKIGIATLATLLFPSMASAQFFVTTSAQELPAPVYNGGHGQPQQLPAPVYNGGYTQPQELPPPVYNGSPAPIPGPQPVFNGWQAQPIPMPHPNNYGGGFTLPDQGVYAPASPDESYRNEVEGYRSMGQSSPVFGNQPYGAYEPRAAPEPGFTIGAVPRVVFVPQPEPSPYVPPLQQQPFPLPQNQPHSNVYSSCWQGFGTCVNAVGSAVSAIKNTAPYQIGSGVFNASKVVTYGTACGATFGLSCGKAITSFGNVVQSADWLSRNVGSPRDYVFSLFGR
jgi:hypothetical protein